VTLALDADTGKELGRFTTPTTAISATGHTRVSGPNGEGMVVADPHGNLFLVDDPTHKSTTKEAK